MAESKIKFVRDRIASRRKTKLPRISSEDKTPHSYVSIEERHGYLPEDISVNNKKGLLRLKRPQLFSIMAKLILSVCLFLFVKLAFMPSSAIPEVLKSRTIDAVTEDFPFAQVYLWYIDTFGIPLSFSGGVMQPESRKSDDNTSLALPVSGQVSSSLTSQRPGILISTKEESKVKAFMDGVVIFAGKDRHTNNKMVIIQHEDSSKTIYGNLSSIDAYLYQFVQQNSIIGTVDPLTTADDFYFAIEKNRQYLDPLQVINIEQND